MSNTVNFEGPALDEFAKASAQAGSVYKGLEHMGGLGMIGTLAKELAGLAEQVAKSGYVPPAKREKHEYHDKLAKSANLDRDVARYHRAKAREIRAQLGEGK
jgi:hypothetical protein